MEHLELHVIKSSHDIELAVIAGLMDEFEDEADISCDLCEKVVEFHLAVPQLGFILLSEDQMKISCETCLTVAVDAVTVSNT